MRRAAKIDGNQPAIVEALRVHGVSVQSLAKVGDGCPDLLCAYRQRTFVVEVKDGYGKLRPSQKKWIAEWHGPVYVARSVDDIPGILSCNS